MGKEHTRKVLGTAALALLATVVTGCSMVEQQASEAVGQLTDAASKEFVRQACAPVQDGQLENSEIRVLTSMIGAIDGGGLPASIIDPLKELADRGDRTAPEKIANSLKQACTDAGAYSG
ncbi:hypothetical protein ACF046_05635 [Glutamicibacter creatinolyticus]|jgi:hypothetical protein|uniref:Cold-shock protein n=2 Tax=Micrococcaceae TaxID=1268 RepID=A0A5B7WYD4_9MICC|nr:MULTISPECIES: hypothetical protein [Glutamicibacter]QCY48415.1 Cold-shock protein [Glutamicibacter creatinolyticus]TLK52951.1 hypothetical protein FDN03_09030 [Glutamicibacter sp. V16R2B1]